jgi:hypothetical protein
MKGQ